MTYNLSLANLKKATGTLLEQEQLAISETIVNRLPTTITSKPVE